MVIPIHLSIVPLMATAMMMHRAKTNTGMPLRSMSGLAGMGWMSAVTPRIRAMLDMFDPATLPSAIPEEPVHAA